MLLWCGKESQIVEKENVVKKILISFAVLLSLIISAFVYAKGTPQYSLYQFRKSIENHDADSALKYLDIDSVVDNMMQDLIKEQEVKHPSSPAESFGNNFAKGLMTMMIPAMKEALKGQIKAGITTPSDKKTPVSGIQKGSFSDFEIKTEGKMAILSRKDDKDLKLKMVKTPEGHWKIVQIMMPATAATQAQ